MTHNSPSKLVIGNGAKHMQKTLCSTAGFVLIVLLLSSISAKATTLIDVTQRPFNAKGDGVTDDTVALQRAAKAAGDAPAGGAELYFPTRKANTYLVSDTILLYSHTDVEGNGSTILASDMFKELHVAARSISLPILENVNHTSSQISDTDLTINHLIIDYGKYKLDGEAHAVQFVKARNWKVTNCIIYDRGRGDGVSGLSVDNALVQGNAVYDFTDSCYDFWGGPTNVRIYDNYAETKEATQMVCFNPDYTYPSDVIVNPCAKGLIMMNNTLVVTGPNSVPSLLAPIGGIAPPGSPTFTVRDMVIANNHLTNTTLVIRGDVQNVVVSGNTISNVSGGSAAITNYPWIGGTSDSIMFFNRTFALAVQDRPRTEVRGQGWRIAPPGH